MFGALRFIRCIMMSVILVVFSAAVVSGNKGVVESVFQPYADLLKEFLIERDLENDGLESAFDYEKALSQEKTMVLLEKQDALMTENTRRALNTHRHLHRDGNILYVSELFEWYEDDYAKEEGSVREFIKAYADDHVKEKVNATTRIRYIDYDWSLNKPGNFPGFEEAFAESD
jgi:hypothetical protein